MTHWLGRDRERETCCSRCCWKALMIRAFCFASSPLAGLGCRRCSPRQRWLLWRHWSTESTSVAHLADHRHQTCCARIHTAFYCNNYHFTFLPEVEIILYGGKNYVWSEKFIFEISGRVPGFLTIRKCASECIGTVALDLHGKTLDKKVSLTLISSEKISSSSTFLCRRVWEGHYY